jgi:hypothetical protein
MRTEKEAKKLANVGNILLSMMTSTDPFETLDLLDKATEMLRDIIPEIENDEFRSEAEDKLQKLLTCRQEIVNRL